MRMKLYRYMSSIEAAKLFHRETIKNTNDYSKKRGTASTAKGFWFGIGGMEQAKKDYRRLKGIVSPIALLVFTPKDINKFTPCKGRYIDYDKIDAEGKAIMDYPIGKGPRKYFDEYCAESYSIDDIKKIEYYEVTRGSFSWSKPNKL